MLTLYLTFSDSAKFAQAAKNIIQGQGATISHSFFNSSILRQYQPGQVFPANFLPLPSWILSLIFRIFPTTDATIFFLGISLFFISSILMYLIGKKLYSKMTGLISLTLFLLNPFIIEYATNFTSEILFIFQILLLIYLLLLAGKQKLFSIIPLLLMFLTRQQASIIVISLLTTSFFFFIKSKLSSTIKITVTLSIAILGLSLLFISKINANSIFSPAKIIGSFQISPNLSPGSYLRGVSFANITTKQLISKVFYNAYNFAKSPARLISPTILFLFLSNLFIKPKNTQVKWFNSFTLITLLFFVIAASITLPNARYIHPVTPLIIICASACLVKLINNFPAKLQNLGLVTLLSFIVLPTLGNLTLDTRARAQQYNFDKPPAYRQIADVMAQYIPSNELIITNLDAWAAWYKGLTTMWFPLQPAMLEGYQDKVGYIVITNYKENDGDFTLGEWEEVVYQPEKIQNEFLRKNYKTLQTFVIDADQVYDNKTYLGTILIRK